MECLVELTANRIECRAATGESAYAQIDSTAQCTSTVRRSKCSIAPTKPVTQEEPTKLSDGPVWGWSGQGCRGAPCGRRVTSGRGCRSTPCGRSVAWSRLRTCGEATPCISSTVEPIRMAQFCPMNISRISDSFVKEQCQHHHGSILSDSRVSDVGQVSIG